MAEFTDTWRLEIDGEANQQLEEAVGTLDKLDDAFARVDKEAEKTNQTLAKTEREAARVAKALERKAAKAAREAANELKRVEREASRAAKALKNEAAKGAREVAKAMAKAEKETLAEAKALERTRAAAKKLNLENTKKGIEGLAAGMQIGAISGERLANVWLAAGAAAGTLAFSGIAVVRGAIDTYIEKSVVAKEASDRLTKAWEKMQIAAVESQLGTTGMTKALDTNTARLNALTESLFPSVDALSRLNEEEEKYVQSGFTDSLTFQASGIGLLVTATEFAIDSFDDLHDIEEKAAAVSFKALTDQLKGVGAEINAILGKAREENEKLDKEEADAAKRRKKEDARKKKTAEREAAMAAKEAARRQAAADKLAEKELSDILNFERGIADAKKFLAVLNDIEAGVSKTGGFAGRAGALTEEAGVGGAVGEFAKKKREAAEAARKGKVDIGGAVDDFGAAGIALATDQLGLFIEQMAAGSLTAADFGKGMLQSIGSWIADFGQAMIIAGAMAQFVQGGELLIAPAAAIGLGIAAVAIGKSMSGISQRGGGRGGGGGGSNRAASAARQVSRNADRSRASREDRQDAAMVVVMDGKVVGRAIRARDAQSRRRGEFDTRGAGA